MDKRLYDTLVEYKNLKMSSFHTPGHKSNFFKKYDLLSLDFTELPSTDSLYESSGAIKASEESVSRVYGTKGTYFSAGGNTLCIQSMIALCVKSGEKLLCDRLVHRSAVSTMALLGIEPVWIKRHVQDSLPMQIDIIDLEKKLNNDSNIKAVYITSPSYQGIMQDIGLISNICKSHGVPLLIDNAHGSHLKFLDLHPLDFGATITADSAHKTLPVLTGGAWLHVNDDKLKINAKSMMSLFGSTSPSYIIMASMDICCSWLERSGKEAYQELKLKTEKIKKIVEDKEFILTDTDPTRITLCANKIGYTGFQLREELYKFNIEPEMCDKNCVVLITSPFNTSEDWKRLEKALQSIKPIKNNRHSESTSNNITLPECVLSFSQAMKEKSRRVRVEESLNEIALEIVCPCPPGIPVVMPGERIGVLEQKLLMEYGILEIDVLK